MTLTASIGVIGLLLSITPAWADDFSAEADFVTRAANGNIFAVAESRLAVGRARAPQVKTFPRRLVGDHLSRNSNFQRSARLAGISGLKGARTGCQISRGFDSEFRPFMNAKSRART